MARFGAPSWKRLNQLSSLKFMQGNNYKRLQNLTYLCFRTLTIFAIVTPLAASPVAPFRSVVYGFTEPGQKAAVALRTQDEAFLEDLTKRAFLFFWEQADPKTGLVLDRSQTN